MGDHFCLKWNNHQENLTGIMTKLLDEQKFVDVSLVCEMKTFKAHQTVLSACSPYFEQVLEENTHPHPIIILRDVKETEMAALLQYMYRGEVSVRDDELTSFLHTARALKVRGLSDAKKDSLVPLLREDLTQNLYVPQSELPSPPKRQKTMAKAAEQEAVDNQNSESPQSQTTSSLCKSTSKPSSGSSHSQINFNYSENATEIHYSDMPLQQQTIKQEVDVSAASSEEQCSPMQQHHLQGNTESRNDQYHKLEEWNFDYSAAVENRNYPSQKVELPKVPIPMTYNFSSQLAGTPMPGLYPCVPKAKPKKDQGLATHDSKPKPSSDSSPGPSFAPNQSVSVIKNVDLSETTASASMQRKGGRFRPGWMENYSWLQYDECLNTMYCKTCRKWSSSVPDIRTSFVEGNGNFRLEIVNHHHKSKAHKLCMAKEEESIPRLDPIFNEDNN